MLEVMLHQEQFQQPMQQLRKFKICSYKYGKSELNKVTNIICYLTKLKNKKSTK